MWFLSVVVEVDVHFAAVIYDYRASEISVNNGPTEPFVKGTLSRRIKVRSKCVVIYVATEQYNMYR